MWSVGRNLVSLALVAAAVWGCSGDQPSAAAKHAVQAAAAKKAANPQEERLRNMVSAVPAARPGPSPSRSNSRCAGVLISASRWTLI